LEPRHLVQKQPSLVRKLLERARLKLARWGLKLLELARLKLAH
jgi:hypothetical protein